MDVISGSDVIIKQAATAEEFETAGSLFREYEKWLGPDLCFQGFEDELRNLPGRYAPPRGRLYIALVDNQPVGCIAMRELTGDICEMKRLFLRETARGHGIGNTLIKLLIADARAIGYERMRLDTYPPKMGKAVSLYKAHGFRPIDAYYENPYSGVLFLELAL